MDELDTEAVVAPGAVVPAARDAMAGSPPGPAGERANGAERDRPGPVDAVAGLITALFSVPEGMAYAAIAGFDPGAGLYSGIWPAVAGSLLVRTPLMVVTLTSAIALTSRGALWHAHLSPAIPANVAALTLLVALAMALFSLLRLGAVLRLVSAGAMTGFSVGIAVQIIAGALHEATGFRTHHHNRLVRVAAWLTHPGAWSGAATAVAVLTVLVWAAAHVVARLRPLAVLLALVTAAAAVHFSGVRVRLAGSLGAIPNGLPHLTVPAWHVMPQLVGGACSVALVALAQAAGIAPTSPADPKRPEPSRRRCDLAAQAAANAVGAFFHALPVGGSLSRTAVAASAGARTRWAGVASGCVLALLVCTLGDETALIPLPVIGALLILIGVKLVVARLADIRAAWRRGHLERWAMAATFLAATQLPLQYALLLGCLVSLVSHAPGYRRSGTVPAVPRP